MTDLNDTLMCEFNIRKEDEYLILDSPAFEDMTITLETDELEYVLSVLLPALNFYYMLADCPQPSRIFLTENETAPAGIYKSFKARIIS